MGIATDTMVTTTEQSAPLKRYCLEHMLIIYFFFIIIIMQRRTVIFECKNYGNELRDAVLDAALDAARLAWQHSHSCSSEFKRVFVFTTSQPVISFISSSLSINSESFCCFNYLSSVRWTTSMLATDLGVNIR